MDGSTAPGIKTEEKVEASHGQGAALTAVGGSGSGGGGKGVEVGFWTRCSQRATGTGSAALSVSIGKPEKDGHHSGPVGSD